MNITPFDSSFIVYLFSIFHRYKIWNYTGDELFTHTIPENGELWEVTWQSKSAGVFPEFPVAAPRPQGRSGAPPQVGGGMFAIAKLPYQIN